MRTLFVENKDDDVADLDSEAQATLNMTKQFVKRKQEQIIRFVEYDEKRVLEITTMNN